MAIAAQSRWTQHRTVDNSQPPDIRKKDAENGSYSFHRSPLFLIHTCASLHCKNAFLLRLRRNEFFLCSRAIVFSSFAYITASAAAASFRICL